MDDRQQSEETEQTSEAVATCNADHAVRVVCASHEVKERGQGVRFTIPSGEAELNAFVIRHRGQLHAYVNRCPHIPEDDVNLDKPDGKFYDRMGKYLECRRHSAWFDPASGECVRGPCRGASLDPLQVTEEGGVVIWVNPARG